MKHWTLRKNIKLAAVLGMMLLLCLALFVGCDEQTDHTHTWKDWEFVIQPTCESKGSQERVCSECGAKEQSYVTELGHDLEKHAAKAPTCTEAGYDAYEACKRCSYTTFAEKAALGHELTKHAAKEPTCTETGYDAYETCGRCDYTTYAEKAALGHELTEHAAKEPTCTETGYDAYETCGRCDHTTYAEKAALGHELTKHEAKAPTCTEAGYYAYETCGRCDHTTYKVWEPVGHLYQKGECQYCGDKDESFREETITPVDQDLMPVPEGSANMFGYVKTVVDAWGNYLFYGVYLPDRQNTASLELTYGPYGPLSMEMYEMDELMYKCVMTYDERGSILSMTVTADEEKATVQFASTYDAAGLLVSQELTLPGIDDSLHIDYEHLEDGTWKATYKEDSYGVSYTCKGWFHVLKVTEWSQRYYCEAIAGVIPPALSYFVPDYWLETLYIRYTSDGEISYKEETTYNERYQELSTICTDGEGNLIEKSEYEYDENGIRKSYSVHDANGNCTEWETYDENGSLAEYGSFRDWDGDGIYDEYYEGVGYKNENGWYSRQEKLRITYDEEGNVMGSVRYAHDEKGRVISEIEYDANDVAVSAWQREYNDHDDIVFEIQYDANGEIVYGTRYEYEYYENGTIKRRVAIDAKGPTTEWIDYDEEERPFRSGGWYDWDEDGICEEYSEYAYFETEDGWRTREVILTEEYNTDGELDCVWKYEYTETGILTYRVCEDPDGAVISWREYDAEGNPLKSGSWYDWDEDGICEIYGEDMYRQTEDGWYESVPLVWIFYDANGKVQYLREYVYNEEDVMIAELVRDANGFVFDKRGYDENGNLLWSYTWSDWDDDGIYNEYVEYSYRVTEDGELESMPLLYREYDANGELILTYEYVYNEEGIATEMFATDANGFVFDRMKYDQNGNPIWEATWFDWNDDGIYENYLEYIYRVAEDGWWENLPILSKEYTDDGELVYICEYSYDENGKLTYQVLKDGNGNILDETIYG